MKDPIPGGLCSSVVYKFACPGCNACYMYVGETTRHFSTCMRKHFVSDRAPHIFKHLQNSEHCRSLCSVDCFHILDRTPLQVSSLDKRGISHSKRTTFFESTITSYQSKTILSILTLSRSMYIPLLLDKHN